MKQLGGPAQAGGADGGARVEFGQFLPPAADQDIHGQFTFRNGADTESCGNLAGHVFHAVHGQVDPPVQQGLLDLLDEKSLTSDLGKRNVLDFVAFGLDDDQFDGKVGMRRSKCILHPVGLPQGQFASPGADF